MAHLDKEHPTKEEIIQELERRSSLIKGNPREKMLKELEKRSSVIKGSSKDRMLRELKKRTAIGNRENRTRISSPKPVRSRGAKNIPILRHRV